MKYLSTDDVNLKRHPASKVYYYVRGRVELSLKTTDLEKAKLLKELREDEFDGLGRAALLYTVKKLYPVYLDHKRLQLAGKSPDRKIIRQGTFNEIEYIFENHLLRFFGSKKLAQVSTPLWSRYCRQANVSDLANHRKVFRGFLKWCKRRGHIKSVPDIEEIPGHRRRPRRIVKPAELSAIFTHASGSLKLFLAIALYNGLRRSEIMRLRWEGIDLAEGRYLTVYADDNKLDRGRTLPINQTLVALLTERKAGPAGRTPWVFPHKDRPREHATVNGLKTAWATCLEKAGLSDITWHDLRATNEKYTNKSKDHTDTQREKFSDASMEVQKRIYIDMDHEDLRGLEDAVQIAGLDEKILGSVCRVGKGTGA